MLLERLQSSLPALTAAAAPQASEVTPRGRREHVRPARFSDYGQIASIQRANNLECEERDRWTRLWLGNPAYEAFGDTWPIGWVLEARDGRVVGTVSNIPLNYTLGGRTLVAAVSRGWAVSEGHRAFSLMLLGRFASQPRADLYLTTSAGAKAAAALSALHWSPAPGGPWDKRGFWVTNYGGFARSSLRISSAPGGPLLGSVVAAPLSAVDRVTRWLSRPPADRLDVGFAGGFDERFDLFWQELKASRPEALLAVRSREVLNWQFLDALRQNRVWIVTVCERGRLLCYGIFERWDKPAFGLTRVRIIDFQSLNRDSRLCAAVLSCALHRSRREGIHVLENRGCWFEGAAFLGRPAPHHVPLEAWSSFYRANDEALERQIEHCWRPTSLDGDSSFA